MKFVLHVLSSPNTTHAVQTALRFAEAAVRQQHQIIGVFFSNEAVALAHVLAESLPEDDPIAQRWVAFSQHHKIALWCCVTAGMRRGVVQPILAGFEIAGLGQLISDTIESDRLLTFH